MPLITKTWPYGTQRKGTVCLTNWRPTGLDPRAPSAQLIRDESNEMHLCIGAAGDPSAQVGDVGTLTFTQGGPTGGYWKFSKVQSSTQPTPELPTWTCHICGRERPDEKINVHVRDCSEEEGLPFGTLGQNVRYCNDDPDCIKAAKTFRFFPPRKS